MRIYSRIFHSLGEGRAVYMSKRKHDDMILKGEVHAASSIRQWRSHPSRAPGAEGINPVKGVRQTIGNDGTQSQVLWG